MLNTAECPLEIVSLTLAISMNLANERPTKGMPASQPGSGTLSAVSAAEKTLSFAGHSVTCL